MKATALKNRAGRSPQSAAGHERVVGDHGVGASAAGGAHVSGGVEREGRHIQAQGVGAADVVRRHGPLGRDEVVVVVGCRLEECLIDGLHGEQARPYARQALPSDVEVRRDEALDDELAAWDAAREHRVHDLVRVRRRRVEVGVARDVLDRQERAARPALAPAPAGRVTSR
jgi:hypothetical protein